jgi:hypothetical protein
MAPRFLTIVTGSNLPKLQQSKEQPSPHRSEDGRMILASHLIIVRMDPEVSNFPGATEKARRLLGTAGSLTDPLAIVGIAIEGNLDVTG